MLVLVLRNQGRVVGLICLDLRLHLFHIDVIQDVERWGQLDLRQRLADVHLLSDSTSSRYWLYSFRLSKSSRVLLKLLVSAVVLLSLNIHLRYPPSNSHLLLDLQVLKGDVRKVGLAKDLPTPRNVAWFRSQRVVLVDTVLATAGQLKGGKSKSSHLMIAG